VLALPTLPLAQETQTFTLFLAEPVFVAPIIQPVVPNGMLRQTYMCL